MHAVPAVFGGKEEMMDIISMLANGTKIEYNGKKYMRVGEAPPVGILAVEIGSNYPVPVVLIPYPPLSPAEPPKRKTGE